MTISGWRDTNSLWRNRRFLPRHWKADTWIAGYTKIRDRRLHHHYFIHSIHWLLHLRILYFFSPNPLSCQFSVPYFFEIFINVLFFVFSEKNSKLLSRTYRSSIHNPIFNISKSTPIFFVNFHCNDLSHPLLRRISFLYRSEIFFIYFISPPSLMTTIWVLVNAFVFYNNNFLVSC